MKKHKGFTLIELLIAVLIVGILASIAYPSYLSSARKTHRADAKVALNDIALRLQRCFTANNTFVAAAGSCAVKDTVVQAAGIDSQNKYYVIVGSGFTAGTFTLTARPKAGMGQTKDKDCQEMTLNESGRKTAINAASVDSTDKCWN